MSDHRFEIKVEFSIYGEDFDWDASLNWNNPGGLDTRIEEWFMNCYAKARSGYDTYAAMRQAEANLQFERAQYERLKAKYDPPPTPWVKPPGCVCGGPSDLYHSYCGACMEAEGQND